MSFEVAPVFVLSFRHRDELVAMTERCGRRAVGARRVDGAERRFIASGAHIAVVDARGALDEAIEAIALLAETVEANGAALLAILSAGDRDRLGDLFGAGATHYLSSPFAAAEYGQALRFATRMTERVAGGHPAARLLLPERDALLAWSWRPGEGRVRLSPGLARTLGLREQDVRLARAARLLGPEGMRRARGAVGALRDRGEPTAFAHDRGGLRLVHHLHDARGLISARVEELDDGFVRTDQRDPLTGLMNGSAARRWLDRMVAGPGVGGGALLLLSVSRFEILSAAFGRETTDALLRVMARRIERVAFRGRRLIARLAGAEFAVGLPSPAALEEAELLGRALVDACSRPFVAGDHVVTLSIHVGIAIASPEDADGGTLIRRASAALAEARADGDPVQLMTDRKAAAAAAANQLEIDLRAALADGQIELLFQPQFSVTTCRVTGVEALARWRHPRLGELGAETLFAAAERSDYLVQLSRHVQQRVVDEVATWPDLLSTLRIAINVTATEMAQPSFADDFLAMLDRGGLARDRVTVEVTETGLIEDLSAASALLARLRFGGLRIAIDDFGTGYSSLAYLKALPLDYLKIDKRLSQDIVGSPRDRVVVRGVIDMARSLGLGVIAEGVETVEQLSLLAKEGCNYYQGFLSAPPLDLPALEALMAAQARASGDSGDGMAAA